jgi:helicase SWR1
MLKKANQKRRLDDLIMQEGEFTTDYFAKTDLEDVLGVDVSSGMDEDERASRLVGPVHNDVALEKRRMQEALTAAEDDEDAEAAKQAYADVELDAPDFGPDEGRVDYPKAGESARDPTRGPDDGRSEEGEGADVDDDDSETGDRGTTDDYMLNYVEYEWNDFFCQYNPKRA